MTKTEFIVMLADRLGQNRQETQKLLNCFLDSLEDILFKEGRVALKDFGSFNVRSRAERKVRHVVTGEIVVIPAEKTVHFNQFQSMKQKLNK